MMLPPRCYQPVIWGGNIKTSARMKPMLGGQWMKVKEHAEIVATLQKKLDDAVELGTRAYEKLAARNEI